MIRKLLIAATFATAGASGAALAHGDYGYGRVITVQPRVSVAFGTGYYDSFRVLFESGGQRYWTHTPYRPGPMIVMPPAYRMYPVSPHALRHHPGWDERRGWRDDYRHDRRHDRHDRHDKRGHSSRY